MFPSKTDAMTTPRVSAVAATTRLVSVGAAGANAVTRADGFFFDAEHDNLLGLVAAARELLGLPDLYG